MTHSKAGGRKIDFPISPLSVVMVARETLGNKKGDIPVFAVPGLSAPVHLGKTIAPDMGSV